MAKTLSITNGKLKSKYNLKGYSTIDIKGLSYNQFRSFIKDIKVSGNNLVMTMDDNYGEYKITFQNYSSLTTLKFGKKSYNIVANKVFDNWLTLNDMDNVNDNGVITGSVYNDTIDLDNSDRALNISTSNGNDKIKITNTSENTVIKSGNGTNSIILDNATGVNSITGGSGVDTLQLTDTDTDNLTTSNLADGNNKVYVKGDGNNVISTGKNNDTFNLQGGSEDNITKISAGAGTNTFNVSNSSEIGNIIINEQNVQAKNTINFSTAFTNDGTSSLERNGADLSFCWGESSKLTLKNYFSTNKKKAVWTFKIAGKTYSYANILKLAEHMTLKGLSGSISGSSYNDVIYSSTSNDTINALKGENVLLFNEGCGADTIVPGGGEDTIIFENLANQEALEDTLNLSR